MSGLQHEWALNPVTALEFCHSEDGRLLLLVGEGVYLKVFEVESGELLAKCQVFEAQAIHGISVTTKHESSNGSRLAAWGGRLFTLLDFDIFEAIISCNVTSVVSSAQTASDWILDGAISPSLEVLSCIFVTAHSAAIYAQVGGFSKGTLSENLSSPSQSILYSAHVVWISANQIMVAAGTVFGEVEVITWDLTSTKPTGSLVFNFTGHEGSIFGVYISTEIIGPDGLPTRLLASCSDDRTIRVWDLSVQPNEQIRQLRGSSPSDLARETGFGENSDISSQESAKRCVAVVMGHASRIWRVRFLTSKISPEFPTKMNVLSFGEDATCQQWSLDFEAKTNHGLAQSTKPVTAPLSAVLSHLETYAYHSGKHLWSAALVPPRDGLYHLATGGADGKVSIYDVFVKGSEGDTGFGSMESVENAVTTSTSVDLSTTITHGWTLQDIIEGLQTLEIVSAETAAVDDVGMITSQGKATAKLIMENLNRYCFVGKNHILATTYLGRILLGSIQSPQKWQELELPGYENYDLRSYSILLGLPTHDSALLTGTNGVIYMYHNNNQITEIFKVKGKVAALFDISLPGSCDIRILITTLGNEEAQIVHIDSQTKLVPQLQSSSTIELLNKFIVTSAGFVNGRLVLGSRGGILAVYCQPPGSGDFKLTPIQQNPGNDAITAIVSIPPLEIVKNVNERSYFVMTSRNGTYSIMCLSVADSSDDPGGFSLEQVHQSTPPFGPMIESAWFEGDELLLYGFRSKNFIVWNETRQLEIANIECGGAHRNYTYIPAVGAGGAGNFAYTKASKLCLHRQRSPSHREIKSGGHGREIKACGLSQGAERLIATAAEDTTIRIWRERQSTSAVVATSLECLAVIEKHTTGIQHLQWSPAPSKDTDYLFSSGGNEEFYVWRITSIPGFGLGVVCEASLTDYSPERDLRIMSFDIEHIDNQSFDSKLAKVTEDAFTISLAYSDSTVKQYLYSRHNGFTRLAQCRYTSSCITQIMNNENFLITTATDGYLAIWDQPKSSEGTSAEIGFRSRGKIHQSAILSLDYDGILATGGDDNALALTSFNGQEVTNRIFVPSAHAAAITGIAFLDRESTSANTRELWSVSGDQRVKRWTIDLGRGGKDVSIREMADDDDIWCSIPDAGGLVRLHTREAGYERCLIWGNGLEIVKVNAKS